MNDSETLKFDKKSIADVLVVSASDDISVCLPIATKLRNSDINTEVYMENKKIKAKFKYADKLQIPFVIIIGEDEIEQNKIKLKNMQTGEEKEIKISNLKEEINLLLFTT